MALTLIDKWWKSSLAMKLNAIVKIKDILAHFSLFPVGRGVYRALLTRFKGRPDEAPPEEIILARSVRHWAGSCDNPEVIRELGEAIDSLQQEAPIFKTQEDEARSRGEAGSPEQ